MTGLTLKSEGRDRRLRELWLTNRSNEHIAKELDVSPTTINEWRRRLELPARRGRRTMPNGKVITAMTEKEIAHIKELRAAGHTYLEIMARTGRGNFAIYRVCHGIHLVPRRILPSEAGEWGERKCLRCNREFKKRYQWNFVCVSCQTSSEWQSGSPMAV